MIDPVRQELLIQAHTVVVKVGTNVLTEADGVLSRPRLQGLADQLHRFLLIGIETDDGDVGRRLVDDVEEKFIAGTLGLQPDGINAEQHVA